LVLVLLLLEEAGERFPRVLCCPNVAAPLTLKLLEFDSPGPELDTLPKKLGEAFPLAAAPRTPKLPYELAAAASTLLRIA
jgi:hypothetical protein